jgi:hypothetical protein
MKTLRELKEFMKPYILERFINESSLQNDLSQFLGFEIELQKLEYDSLDYCMGVNLDLGDKDLYFDIYYLIDRQDFICITDFIFDSDNCLNSLDDDKKITGVAQ